MRTEPGEPGHRSSCRGRGDQGDAGVAGRLRSVLGNLRIRRWLCSHPYSQARRWTLARVAGGRHGEQVSGNHRRQQTAVSIYATQGLGVQIPSAPPTPPMTSGNAGH